MRVFYADYGNEEVIPITDIRAIPGDLVTVLPRQAIKCSLSGIKPDPMNKELTKHFEDLTLDDRLTMTVLDGSGDSVVVSLSSGSSAVGQVKKDIAQMLKALGSAPKVPDVERHVERSSQQQQEAFKPMPAKSQR